MEFKASNGYKLKNAPIVLEAIDCRLSEIAADTPEYWALIEWREEIRKMDEDLKQNGLKFYI